MIEYVQRTWDYGDETSVLVVTAPNAEEFLREIEILEQAKNKGGPVYNINVTATDPVEVAKAVSRHLSGDNV